MYSKEHMWCTTLPTEDDVSFAPKVVSFKLIFASSWNEIFMDEMTYILVLISGKMTILQ